MMRGGHLDVCVLGAFQVSVRGDLANWHTGAPGAIPAVGGAMDLATGARDVFVMMTLFTREGSPKLVPECTYPLTGARRVSRVYTSHAVSAIAYQDATLIWRETGDQHREGTALNSLSLALQEAQRFDEAITASEAAAAIFRETGDGGLESLALSSLSNALKEAERFEEAIAAAQNAIGVCQQIGDRHREGRAQFILANAYQGQITSMRPLPPTKPQCACRSRPAISTARPRQKITSPYSCNKEGGSTTPSPSSKSPRRTSGRPEISTTKALRNSTSA